VTKSFQIGPVATQVSVIQYTSEPIPEFDLNDFKTAAEVEDGIKRMRLQNGSTRTDKARALEFVSNVIFTKSNNYKLITNWKKMK
jgi:hypothetical protein